MKFVKLEPRQLMRSLLILVLLVWIAIWQWPDNRLHIYFFDVGQGDSILIKTPQNFQILIDGGPDQAVLEELGRVMPFYDRKIDLVILTHPHADHVVGLIEVLRRYQVDLVFANRVSYDSAEYRAFWQKLTELEIPVQGFVQGQKVELSDGVKLTAFWPLAQTSLWEITDVNRASTVFRLDYGGFAALFTGDAELGPENPGLMIYILSQEPDEAAVDILKVPHQGSKGAVTARVLEKLEPRLAVIPVGENRFGHPAQEVVELLSSMGIQTLRTDQAGTIEVVSDGQNWYTRKHGD